VRKWLEKKSCRVINGQKQKDGKKKKSQRRFADEKMEIGDASGIDTRPQSSA